MELTDTIAKGKNIPYGKLKNGYLVTPTSGHRVV